MMQNVYKTQTLLKTQSIKGECIDIMFYSDPQTTTHNPFWYQIIYFTPKQNKNNNHFFSTELFPNSFSRTSAKLI